MSMSSPLALAGLPAFSAEQLTRAGLKVVSLEQGEIRDTALNFSHDHDELRYQVRRDMMVDLQNETWTWRPSPKDTALPMRQYGSFNPGKGTGGAGGALGGPALALLPVRFPVSHPSHRTLW